MYFAQSGSFVQKIIQICVHGSSINNGTAVWQGAQLIQRFLQKGEVANQKCAKSHRHCIKKSANFFVAGQVIT
jgi:hypothetical protein